MRKILVFFTLLFCYFTYSGWVYTSGTNTALNMSLQEQQGKRIFEKNNCSGCHQLFGLGGYLGPELTTIISNRQREPAYARVMLRSGGVRMPNFHFSEKEIDALISFLEYVDRTAVTYKTSSSM